VSTTGATVHVQNSNYSLHRSSSSGVDQTRFIAWTQFSKLYRLIPWLSPQSAQHCGFTALCLNANTLQCSKHLNKSCERMPLFCLTLFCLKKILLCMKSLKLFKLVF